MWEITTGRHPGTLKGINSDGEQLSAPNHSILLWHRARRYSIRMGQHPAAIHSRLLGDQAVAMSYVHIDDRRPERYPDLSPSRVIRTMQGLIRLAQPRRPYILERCLVTADPYGGWEVWLLDDAGRLDHFMAGSQERLRHLRVTRPRPESTGISMAVRYWSPHTRSR